MAFPDSSKKAPNVFLDSIDGTGTPNATGSVSASNGVIVYNLPPSNLPGRPTDVVATLRDTTVNTADILTTFGLSLIDGKLEMHEFATSVIYPTITEDTFKVIGMKPIAGYLFSGSSDSLSANNLPIISGSLNTTIAYITYNDGAIENITASGLPLISGTLITTIEYITYNNWQTENITAAGLTIQSGSLV